MRQTRPADSLERRSRGQLRQIAAGIGDIAGGNGPEARDFLVVSVRTTLPGVPITSERSGITFAFGDQRAGADEAFAPTTA
jgi:hypothetical protein